MSDFLFGSSPDTSTTTVNPLTKEQQELLKKLLGAVGEGAGNLNTSDFGLAPSQLELSSLAGLEQLVNQIPGALDPAQKQQLDETTSAGLSGLEDLFTQGPQDIDDFFTKTVQDPLLESFSEDILPALQTKHASSFFGGERRQAEARAREDVLDTLVQERARIGFESRESDLNRRVAAASVLPGLGEFAATKDFINPSARAALLAGLFKTGQDVSITKQKQLDERSRRINEILASLGVQGVENVVTASEGSGGFLSAIAPDLIAGGFSLSDERAKVNKKRVGQTDKGVPIYTFEYKGDPLHELRMGVMAQELEKLDPGAVASYKGVKFVDMEAL